MLFLSTKFTSMETPHGLSIALVDERPGIELYLEVDLQTLPGGLLEDRCSEESCKRQESSVACATLSGADLATHLPVDRWLRDRAIKPRRRGKHCGWLGSRFDGSGSMHVRGRNGA